MEADRPPPEPEPESAPDAELGDAGEDDPIDEQPPIPAVVAVVVAADEAPHLEACLASLVGSDYPDLTVLVLTRGADDLRPRVAQVAPRAFVRAMGDVDVATAANEAMTMVSGAPFLLFCHDDVVVDPGAVRVLVEEAYRSNAAVVGPKIVDPERPEILREVGWSVDRFGVPHSEIVSDELDQEQHDAVRDVFFVRDACVLVRADLFAALGGFVPESDAARALDLCWRARLAGARVIVDPDARVGHHAADGPEALDRRRSQRAEVRTLLTCTSAVRLLWIVPIAFFIQLAEAAVLLLRRRRDRAVVGLGAWAANLRHPGALAGARRRAQALRVVSDAEIHALQYRGSARFSAYMTASLHAPDRVRQISDRGRGLADTTTAWLRTVRGIVVVVLGALVLVGIRDLVFGRVAAVGTAGAWPGFADLVRSFTSEWRDAGLGAHAPAPPALIIAALMRVLTLGTSGLGRTLFVVGCLPVGMTGAWALARRIAGTGWPSVAGLIAYSINPVSRNALQHGHLGALVVFAAAPWVALVVFQLGGLVPMRWPRRRVVALGAVGVALAAAWWPLAVAYPVVLLLVGLAFPSAAARLTRGTAAMVGWGIALLFPWPIAFFADGDRLGALGIASRGPSSFADVLRFVTGGNGTGVAGWALVVAAIVATLLATGEGGRWCLGWWCVALASWLLAMLPGWTGSAGPELEAVLVPAALALAMIVAIGVSTFLTQILRAGIGWRQVGAVLAGAVLMLEVVGFLGDVAGGRFHQPSGDWPDALGWMQAQRDQGPFRALWIGSPTVVPGALHRVDETAYAVTVDGSGDLRDALAPPGGRGSAAVSAAVRALLEGTTTRLGQRVGPMAIRYVVVPMRESPGAAGSDPATATVRARLAQQLDLRELQGAPGAVVYENLGWLPGDAVVTGGIPAGRAPVGPSTPHRRVGVGRPVDGTVLWSQQYSDAWSLDAAAAGRHVRADGWANAFVGARSARRVSFTDQWWRWPMLLIEIVIAAWMARAVLRRGRAARRRRMLAAGGNGDAS